MLNPNQGEWHEQISEDPEYCEICAIDPKLPPIEPLEEYWLWIIDDDEDEPKQINICNECRNTMFERYDRSH